MRSSSLPRNGLARRENLINSGYGSLLDTTNPRIMPNHRNNYSRDLNASDMYGSPEVLRTEGDDRRETPTRGILQGRGSVQHQGYNQSFNQGYNQAYVSHQRAETQPAENWEEFMSIQGGIANFNEQQRAREEKQRTMKYRELLDQMVQQEKRKKMEMNREYREPPTKNYEELEILTKMERMKEKEDKMMYQSDLKQLVAVKNEQRRQEVQKRYLEENEYQRTRDLVKQYEQYTATLPDPRSRPTFEEYKRMLQMQERKQQAGGNEETAMNEDNGRIQEFTGSKYYPAQEVDRNKKLDQFIHQAVKKKEEQDALEDFRRRENHKRMQMDTISTINKQNIEKYNSRVKESMDKKEEYQNFLENQRLLGQIDTMKKHYEMNQKQDYLDVLRYQKQERREAKEKESNLTTLEKALNYRKPNDTGAPPMNSLNFEGTCHERNLQLKYIDKWLTKPI